MPERNLAGMWNCIPAKFYGNIIVFREEIYATI